MAILGVGWAMSAPADPPAAPLPTAEEREYQLKGAFLTKFAAFTEWPAGAFTNATAPIVIGIMRPGLLGPEYEQVLKGQRANGHPFALRHIKSREDLEGCHILFINGTSRTRRVDILAGAAKSPMLTVGEGNGFIAQGGIIEFFKDEGRVRFEINVDAAARAGLKLSAKLLQLARIVRNAPGGAPQPTPK